MENKEVRIICKNLNICYDDINSTLVRMFIMQFDWYAYDVRVFTDHGQENVVVLPWRNYDDTALDMFVEHMEDKGYTLKIEKESLHER